MLHLFGLEIRLKHLIILTLVTVLSINLYNGAVNAIDTVKGNKSHLVK